MPLVGNGIWQKEHIFKFRLSTVLYCNCEYLRIELSRDDDDTEFSVCMALYQYTSPKNIFQHLSSDIYELSTHI